MQDVLTLILGGGRGASLYPLTRHRSEPAVPLGGKYRLIDVPLSSCLNSGLNKIFVLTQYLSVSLHRHIASTYKLDPFNGGFIEVLAAQQTNETADWYRGTADALRQNRPYLDSCDARDILVLYGDQIYRMDFRQLVDEHRRRGADVTLGVLPVSQERTARLGIVQADDEDRVLALSERPLPPEVLDRLRLTPEQRRRYQLAPDGRDYLANTGIYLFRREALAELFDAFPGGTDLVNDLLAGSLKTHQVRAHFFDTYWEDLGTIRSYFEAHLAMLRDDPAFDFHAIEGAVYTRTRNLPAARILDARVDHCLIADGCTLHPGARLERCIIGIRSQVGAGVQMRNTIMSGADHYESEEQKAAGRRADIPGFGVGEGSVIEKAILDKDCRIGRNVRIVNERGVANLETEDYVIRDGIVVIPNGGIIRDGTVI